LSELRFGDLCENPYFNPKVILMNQYVVEQAPSPAKYSRGRLFHMIFAEVSVLKWLLLQVITVDLRVAPPWL
jgi:hypothetical protein